jgi:hypothetical protein
MSNTTGGNMTETELEYKIEEYESLYFEDFTLQPNSILHDLLVYEVTSNGKTFKTSDDLPTDLELWENYTFKIKKLKGFAGVCNNRLKTLTIDPGYADNPAVILHEMVHAYINLFKQSKYKIIETLFECLLLRIYNDLKTKIPDLENRIIGHTHTIKQEDFNGMGSHGLLFYLKSLDLDLRLGFPLGTVCGYGR